MGTEWPETEWYVRSEIDGNPFGRFNQNPILDMCLTMVEFPGGEITGLAANIAESMYAQYDVNGNDFLLLEIFFNHRKIGSVVSVEEQKVKVMGQENLRK